MNFPADLLEKLDPYDLGMLREGSVISANMLESDSAFIGRSCLAADKLFHYQNIMSFGDTSD